MKQITDNIKKPEVVFWVSLITPLVYFAVSWGVFKTRLDATDVQMFSLRTAHAAQVAECDARSVESNGLFADIRVRLAELQKDVDYLVEMQDR
jgi:hypothetical protein